MTAPAHPELEKKVYIIIFEDGTKFTRILTDIEFINHRKIADKINAKIKLAWNQKMEDN